MNVRRVLSRLLVLYPLALLLSAPAEASIPSSPAPAIARADDARGASLTLSSDQEPSALFAGVSLDPEESPSTLAAASSPRLFENVSLLDSQPRRAPPEFTLETRIGVISFFGQPVIAVHRGASLELHWGSGGLFRKTAMGLGEPDSANTYVWGVSGPWAHDPMGLADDEDKPIGNRIVDAISASPVGRGVRSVGRQIETASDKVGELTGLWAKSKLRSYSAVDPQAEELKREVGADGAYGGLQPGRTVNERMADAGQDLARRGGKELSRQAIYLAGGKAVGEFGAVLEREIAGGRTLAREAKALTGGGLPVGKTFEGRIYRAGSSRYPATTWKITPGNIAADHRYSGKGVGAVYTSTDIETAWLETERADPATRTFESRYVRAKNLLDLTDPSIRRQLGVSERDITAFRGQGGYAVTHQIGDWARKHYSGIIAPSAQNPGGVNVIFFEDLK